MTRADIHLNDPQTLYRHWEDSQWNPFEIDLDRDREQWAQMGEGDRELVYWALASLMVAEERITTKFLGPGRRVRQRGGGDLPLDPAGRRGAAHAVLRAVSG